MANRRDYLKHLGFTYTTSITMEKIGIIGHELISVAALQGIAREIGKHVVLVNHPPEQLAPVKIKPVELVELPRPFKDDRPCLSKYRKGHHQPKISATQWRKARKRKNKIQAKSRRKNHYKQQ